ncbi:chromobox protein homolog 5 [Tetranychus urticae]|uniref:Chromo domain-containing protein n=1 Tax=Tetranychus urticae TaxID=32264 RepID=T1KH49_TETUR|nr:chromobox protein homolog 5 [Tetranychus urticae]
MSETENTPDDVDSDGSEEPEVEYVVESIVDKRKKNGRIEYLIKWKDWPEEDNTWEPENHLSCPDLVEEFEKNLQAKKERSKAKIREKELERAKKFKSKEKVKKKSRDRVEDDLSGRKKKARVIESSSGTPSPACVENGSSSNRFFPSDDSISSDNDESNDLKKRLKAISENKTFSKLTNIKQESSDEADDDNEEEDGVTGFDRGLEPKKIIGAIRVEDKLMFLIKWESCKKSDLILAEEANIRCPQVVISYYEKRLKWVPDFNGNDEN